MSLTLLGSEEDGWERTETKKWGHVGPTRSEAVANPYVCSISLPEIISLQYNSKVTWFFRIEKCVRIIELGMVSPHACSTKGSTINKTVNRGIFLNAYAILALCLLPLPFSIPPDRFNNHVLIKFMIQALKSRFLLCLRSQQAFSVACQPLRMEGREVQVKKKFSQFQGHKAITLKQSNISEGLFYLVLFSLLIRVPGSVVLCVSLDQSTLSQNCEGWQYLYFNEGQVCPHERINSRERLFYLANIARIALSACANLLVLVAAAQAVSSFLLPEPDSHIVSSCWCGWTRRREVS